MTFISTLIFLAVSTIFVISSASVIPYKVSKQKQPFNVFSQSQLELQVSSHAEDAEPSSDEKTCFPSHATIQLSNGQIKTMSQLQVGDNVLVSTSNDNNNNVNHYSKVFMFTHRLHNIHYKFVHLITESNHSITLTPTHYIYINDDQLVKASNVRVGDSLFVPNTDNDNKDERSKSMSSKVTSIRSVMNRGLYNPQTLSGDIVVNGIKVSTYTSAIESNTAHALLTPLRAVYDYLGFSFNIFKHGTKISSSYN